MSHSIEAGDHLELSSIQTTVHIGAHADAPCHYVKGGATIEARSLDYYLGTAQVISVSSLAAEERITPQHIQNVKINAPRVLFYTHSFSDPNHWHDDFNSLSAELIEYLSTYKVITVGIDTPSVDPAQAKFLTAHHAIAHHDMAILEGLVLSEVPEGIYELIALPLKLKGMDASPMRAILRELDQRSS